MVKIRLEGEKDEVAEAVDALDDAFRLLSVSRPYQNRGTSVYVRVYIDAEAKEEHEDE